MKRLTLFFDADDTLLDFDAAETAAITHLFSEYNLLEHKGIVKTYKEKNLQCWKEFEKGFIERRQIGYERFKRTFDVYNIPFNFDLDELNKRYWHYLGQQYEVIEGSKDMLDKLAKEHDLYVITNGTTCVQNSRFELSGYDKYFIKRYISENIGAKKPQKEFFEYIEKDIGNIDRNNSYVIGDSLTSDIKAGENALIKTIWYNRKNEVNTTDIKPDYEVRNYDELILLLDKLAED